jgi:GcrA cell cycle regulator
MTFWTNDRTTLLKQLHALGKSTLEITREVGAVSRNAIIGKLHRLGIVRTNSIRTDREPSIKREFERVPARRFKKVKLRLPPRPNRSRSTKGGVNLYDAKSWHCRWIEGEASTMLFCGDVVKPGTSWCEGHFKRMHPLSRDRQQ